MCEVLRRDFDEKYSVIEKIIKESVFIAVDSEFSGLTAIPEAKSSLFDRGSDRYVNLKKNIEQFLILQVGLSAFHFKRETSRYLAYTFTFPLFPRSCASLDRKFLCQASSLEFLSHYNFDFNKVVYDGVPFLSYQHEAQLRQELKEGTLFRHLERTVSMDDEHKIQEECSKVSEWANSKVKDVDELVLSDSVHYQSGKLSEYLLLKELRRRFPKLWSYMKNGKVHVKSVTPAERMNLEDNMKAESVLEENLINHFFGFSRIFKLLTELKKPIVGHNLLLDLMLLYNQFHEPLPSNYSAFKKNINFLFPHIFDTKFISFEAKRMLPRDTLSSNVLSELYKFFIKGNGLNLTRAAPVVESAENYDPTVLASRFHEAGWDAYCTGYCFVKLAYIYAEKLHHSKEKPIIYSPTTSLELLGAVDGMKNKVNVVRADVSYLSLDGPDPKSDRPQWLLVQSRNGKTLNISEVAEQFARFGAVDVKPFSKNQALTAIGNHRTAQEIMLKLRHHESFKVTKYNALKHSPTVRKALWTCALVCTGSAGYIIYSSLKQ